MYNLYADNTDNLNKFELYTTQYKFEFLVINSLSISSSNDLGPTSSFFFTYVDKVMLIKYKNLGLD